MPQEVPARCSNEKKCREIMARTLFTIGSREAIQNAGKIMLRADIGALPVVDDEKLVGILTDRDIVVRAVAEGLPPTTPVAEVMSRQIVRVYEDDPIFKALELMKSNRIRRIPVLSREEKLVGIISIADIALEVEDERDIAETLEAISSGFGFWSKRN